MLKNSSYWKENFLPGKCYRDFYCGKIHLLVKLFTFFEEGLKADELCIYLGSLRRRFLIKTYPGNFDFEQMLKQKQIMLDEKHGGLLPSEYILGSSYLQQIEETRISNGFNRARIFWQADQCTPGLLKSFNRIRARMEEQLIGMSIFILYLFNFDCLKG